MPKVDDTDKSVKYHKECDNGKRNYDTTKGSHKQKEV